MSRPKVHSLACSILCAIQVQLASLAPVARAQVGAFVGSWPAQGPPLGLAISISGNVLVTSTKQANAAVYEYSASGSLLARFNPGSGYDAYGIVVAPNGDVFVANYYFSRVQQFNSAGVLVGQWDPGQAITTTDLALDASGNVYVTGSDQSWIRKFTSSGVLLKQWTNRSSPVGIAFAGGVIYVVGYAGGVITKYSTDGTPLGSFPTGATGPEQLTISSDGRLCLADYGSSRLLIFTSNGTLLQSLGSNVAGYTYGPVRYTSVALTRDGTVFVGDYDHNRVLRFVSDLMTPATRETWGGVKARYRQPAPGAAATPQDK